MTLLDQPTTVSIIDCGRFDYPRQGPFHPAEAFPEYAWGAAHLDPANYVYGAVREMLRQLGLDQARFGTKDWNPFGDFIKPGQNVIVKPNLVISEHNLGDIGLLSSVAHGSVIRPLVDYAVKANRGAGWVTICDSPIKEVDFDKITTFNGLQAVIRFFAEQGRADVRLLDIRDLQVTRDKNMVMVATKELPGDPLGYTVVDLGRESMLAEVAQHNTRFRSTAAVYENRMAETHTDTINLYSMPNTILQSDCIISVAKLKNHRKCGVTLSLKNKIGTTNEKRWLPHHRVGTPSKGGDMTPDNAPPTRKINEVLKDNFISHKYGRLGFKYLVPILKFINTYLVKPWARKVFAKRETSNFGEGDWWGNDTIHRTTLDLNMILRYADKGGRMQRTVQRSYLTVIDGILGGHREGPLKPEPKECGLIVGGTDPVAVDVVCTHAIGFDPDKIRMFTDSVRLAYPLGTRKPELITVRSNLPRWERWLEPDYDHLGFVPAAGWKNYVERQHGQYGPAGAGARAPRPSPVPGRPAGVA